MAASDLILVCHEPTTASPRGKSYQTGPFFILASTSPAPFLPTALAILAPPYHRSCLLQPIIHPPLPHNPRQPPLAVTSCTTYLDTALVLALLLPLCSLVSFPSPASLSVPYPFPPSAPNLYIQTTSASCKPPSLYAEHTDLHRADFTSGPEVPYTGRCEAYVTSTNLHPHRPTPSPPPLPPR